MTAKINKQYEYNFQANLSPTLENYDTVLILCSNLEFDEIKRKLLEKLQISIPDEITTVYNGEKGSCVYFYVGKTTYVLMKFSSNPNNILKMSGILGKKICSRDGCDPVSVLIILCSKDLSFISSLLQGLYRYENLKTDKPQKITLDFYSLDGLKFKAQMDKIIAQNLIQYEIRDLINAPVNILNSDTYLNYIKANLKTHIEDYIKSMEIPSPQKQKFTFEVIIYEEDDLTAMDFNLLLAVNQGSKQKAKLLLLKYLPNYEELQHPIYLIGKGVMFDTGGINLKHGDFSDMKTDMAGTAIVYGIMKALAIHKYNRNVIGVLPLVQNDIGENAIHPGDVIISKSGKTVEISDTDAEGRLILADCLYYASEKNTPLIIDIATLTGQAVSIFGGLATAIMGNNPDIINGIIKAGIIENEKIWELPLWDEYKNATKSKIADLVNHSNVGASTIMGGAFLSNFVSLGKNWVHLDIAGVSFNENDTPTKYAGATGAIFNTLVNYLINDWKKRAEAQEFASE